MGALAAGARIDLGLAESARQILEISLALQHAHEQGLATILWCSLRNPAFKTKERDDPRHERARRPGARPGLREVL